MTDNLYVFEDERKQRIAAMSFKEKLEKLRAGIRIPTPDEYRKEQELKELSSLFAPNDRI